MSLSRNRSSSSVESDCCSASMPLREDGRLRNPHALGACFLVPLQRRLIVAPHHRPILRVEVAQFLLRLAMAVLRSFQVRDECVPKVTIALCLGGLLVALRGLLCREPRRLRL